MNKEQQNFLLKYAKIGVLSEMDNANKIDAQILLQTYLKIDSQLKEVAPVVPTTEASAQTQPDPKKKSVVTDWFKGIGDRQRAYEKGKKKGTLN